MEPVKIIVRYADGQILKGYTHNFSPGGTSFHARLLPMSSEFIEVRIEDLKAVFFVKDFAGDPRHRERRDFPPGVKPFGKLVEVEFDDGEVVVGAVLNYELKKPGFFIFPADPESNNLRIFAVSKAVRSVVPV